MSSDIWYFALVYWRDIESDKHPSRFRNIGFDSSPVHILSLLGHQAKWSPYRDEANRRFEISAVASQYHSSCKLNVVQ